MRVGGGRHPARSRPRRTVKSPRRSRESLGRRRRRRERPIPGGHPTTTRVSELLFTGAIGKVMQGRAREGSSCARWDRSPRRRELHRCDAGSRATGGSSRGSLVRPSGRPEARAMLETASPHRPSIRAPRGERDRAPRGERKRRRGLGHVVVLRGSMTRQSLSPPSLGAPLPLPKRASGRAGGGARTGSPDRAKHGGGGKVPRAIPKPRTVHAAWRRWPRLSGTTRGR